MKPISASALASALGKLAKGAPKNFSAKERARRSKAMVAMNRSRRKVC